MSSRLMYMLLIGMILAVTIRGQDDGQNSDSQEQEQQQQESAQDDPQDDSQEDPQEDPNQDPQEDPQEDPNQDQLSTLEQTTNGIMGAIVPYFHPLLTLLYQLIDSILRNVFNVSLPCTITDFTRLDIECTPL